MLYIHWNDYNELRKKYSQLRRKFFCPANYERTVKTLFWPSVAVSVCLKLSLKSSQAYPGAGCDFIRVIPVLYMYTLWWHS
jgi:hypothetical protein